MRTTNPRIRVSWGAQVRGLARAAKSINWFLLTPSLDLNGGGGMPPASLPFRARGTAGGERGRVCRTTRIGFFQNFLNRITARSNGVCK
jgi:hypothetical protein